MRIKHCLVVLASFLFIQNVSATSVWVGTVTVGHYYPISGVSLFKMTGSHQNPAGCSSDFWYAVDPENPSAEDYKKLLLTAVAAGKKVAVFLHDDQCVWDAYPSVYSMHIDLL
jgi:hypothetical protein